MHLSFTRHFVALCIICISIAACQPKMNESLKYAVFNFAKSLEILIFVGSLYQTVLLSGKLSFRWKLSEKVRVENN